VLNVRPVAKRRVLNVRPVAKRRVLNVKHLANYVNASTVETQFLGNAVKSTGETKEMPASLIQITCKLVTSDKLKS
jgi:hypothetical protein